jgi:nitroreductase
MVLKEIISRRSILAFDSKPIPDQQLVSLFEAARWAPSSFNEQPWRFIIAKRDNEAQFMKMVSCVNDWNEVWASKAAVLLICIARLNATDQDIPNKHALYDLGLAVGNLSVQATSMDLHMRQMAGFHPEIAIEKYHIPAGYEPVCMIALGYQGDAGKLPENLKRKENFPRIRKPLSDLVFEDEFGLSSSLVKKGESAEPDNDQA